MTPDPFADDNLALAVLQACIDEKLVEKPDYEALLAANPYDEEADENEYNTLNEGVRIDLVSYLEAHGQTAVGKITEISWHVPADVMFACWPQFDGESDEFELTSLEGIERCGLLQVLSVQGVDTALDLTPLVHLPELQELRIDHAPNIEPSSWAALLEVPGLKKVRAKVPEAVAEKLRARQVVVEDR